MTSLPKSTATSEIDRGLTKLDSFLQLFCILQGPCFFLFPGFFKNVGAIPGICLACVVSITYLYLVRLYFWSESKLKKYDSSIDTVTLYTLVELVFARIGKFPRLGLYLKLYLQYEIILSWFLGMSFTLRFICKNVKVILHNYNYEEDERMIVLYIALPLAVVCFTPDLATLNKGFYLTSVFVGIIFVETYFYIFSDKRAPLTKIQFFGTFDAIPTYINNIFFSTNVTPLLYLYKKEMKREGDLYSLLGSLNIAVCSTILLSLFYSISCNIFFENVGENIIESLPNNLLTNLSNTIMTITIILGGAVCFYALFLCLRESILEKFLKDSKRVKFYDYTSKVIVYSMILGVTLIVPSLSSFLDLISCFSFPYDSVILPVALETIIVWRLSENKFKKVFVSFKNSVIAVIAVVFAISSLIDAVWLLKF